MEEEPHCRIVVKASCCDMKGFLSFLILWIISKKSMKGSDVRKELEVRKGSRPSPGTIYPVLKELREKGLLEVDENKVYSLTEKGRDELELALGNFSQIFYDAGEMFECCKPEGTQPENGGKKGRPKSHYFYRE